MEVTTFRNRKSRMKQFGKTQKRSRGTTFSSLSIFNVIFHPAHLKKSIPSTLGIMFSFGPSALWRQFEDLSLDSALLFHTE